MDPPACTPAPEATGEDAHPVAGGAWAAAVATGAVAEDAEDGADDGAATGALDWAVAVWTDVAGLDAVGVVEEQAATVVRAQAAPMAGTTRNTDRELAGNILISCAGIICFAIKDAARM